MYPRLPAQPEGSALHERVAKVAADAEGDERKVRPPEELLVVVLGQHLLAPAVAAARL